MLSTDLFHEVRPEFLRLLGAQGARVYLDAADAVERESALRPAPVPREAALLQEQARCGEGIVCE